MDIRSDAITTFAGHDGHTGVQLMQMVIFEVVSLPRIMVTGVLADQKGILSHRS